MKRKFIEQLVAWKKQHPPSRKPLILRGARQVGKTYILEEFGKHYFPNFYYFNFEKESSLHKIFDYDLDPQRIINELSIRVNQQINIKKDLIIFDEIQSCPKALTSLKYFNEELPELHLCAAGSLLGIHLNQVSYPVGKVNTLTMHPMSFEEFLMALREEKAMEVLEEHRNLFTKKEKKTKSHFPEVLHEHLWGLLKLYFVVGGLPEVVSIFITNKRDLQLSLENVRKKQEELIIDYQSDMTKHSGKVNAMHIDRIWKAIPAQLAQSQDGSINKFKFKDVIPGISRYDRLVSGIDWLEAAGLILKVPIAKCARIPLSAYIKENSFKLLSFDVGILGAMSGLAPKVILDYDYGSYKGYFAENFVAQEFVCSNKRLFSWEEGEAEVEFLWEEDGEIIPIEVKSGWITKARSLQSFNEKYHPRCQVILSGKNFHFSQKNQKYYCPLYFAGFF